MKDGSLPIAGEKCGLVVAAVDGIEICSSLVRCCDACMEREVQHKVNGDRYAVLSPDRRGRCGQHVLPHPLGSSLSEERVRGGSMYAGPAPSPATVVRAASPGWTGWC